DLALLWCSALRDVRPFPLEFDQTLAIGDQVTAIGFPMAVDPEWVSIAHRGFTGHVVTRRELYHIQPDQPPGYEVSFLAPRGLSGAPLVSRRRGDHYCFGYIVQQSTIGTSADPTPVGIAVDIKVLLTVRSKIIGNTMASLFGRELITLTATPPQLPGGI